MRRILSTITVAILIYLIPFSIVTGQEKKNEQKIKIVVDDGSGTKVVIDTIIIAETATDSIKLKDGKVIYIGNLSGDYDSKAHKGKSEVKCRVISSMSDEGGKGEKYIYINEGKVPEKEIEKTFDVYVSNDDRDSTVEMTKYVIAKDGLVVTVEGKDETKAKDLVDEIRNKMGIKNDGTDKNESVKVKTK
jgi:ABC-type Na+ efflux pump permease subunit